MFRAFGIAVLWLAMINMVQAQSGVAAPPGQAQALSKLARQIEPDLVGRVDRLPQYIDCFRLTLGNDSRLFVFEVEAVATETGRVRLQGYVEFSQTRAGLREFLEILGFEVCADGLTSLPARQLGDKAFGYVKTAHTFSYSRPTEPRNVVTDCLLGERLYLLREEAGYLLVHSGEGYLGYVAAADVQRVAAADFSRYPTDESVRIIADHQLGRDLVLPAGALLKRLADDGERVVCALPTGAAVTIPSAACQPTRSAKADIERAISAGEQLLGTPYHWGGKTSSGIDCSGLVQVAFATAGVQLPRDSNQQFFLGELTATRWHRANLRRGDTLYFLGPYGRIRHTAIYLGGDRYLQAEMPAVDIRSFNPEHEDYDARRAASFAFGKRLWQ